MRDVDQIYRLLSGRQIDAGDEIVKVEDAVAAVKRWFHGREEMTTLNAMEVADMEPPEAVELFQRCAKIKEKGQDIATEVAQIVKELGHLALAITLAGSHVSETPRLSSDIGRYLPEYRQRQKELLRRRAKRHIHQYGESFLSTWEDSCIDAWSAEAYYSLTLLTYLRHLSPKMLV